MSENETAREKKRAQNEKRLSQEAEQARRNYETASRKVSDWMDLSPLCPHPRCKRRRRCNGDFGSDGLFCFAEAPGEIKLWLDRLCQVVAEGGSFEEAKVVAGMAALDLRRNRERDQLMRGITSYAGKILERAQSRMHEEEKEDMSQSTLSAGTVK